MRSAAAILLGAALALAGPAGAGAPNLEDAARLILLATNQARVDQGLAPVANDAALERAARSFAQHMARTDRYGHTADGSEPAARARARGYDYCYVAENIAYQASSAEFDAADLAARYVEGWLASPGHRRNLLEAGATDIGIAVARSERSGRYYAVQLFGRPMRRSLEFQVANEGIDTVEYRVGDKAYRLPPGMTRTHRQCAAEEVALPRGRIARPAHGERLVVGARR